MSPPLIQARSEPRVVKDGNLKRLEKGQNGTVGARGRAVLPPINRGKRDVEKSTEAFLRESERASKAYETFPRHSFPG